jgi:hypothetical protein
VQKLILTADPAIEYGLFNSKLPFGTILHFEYLYIFDANLCKNINCKLFFQKIIAIFVAEIKNTSELKLEKYRVENPKIHRKESLFKKNNNHAFALQP